MLVQPLRKSRRIHVYAAPAPQVGEEGLGDFVLGPPSSAAGGARQRRHPHILPLLRGHGCGRAQRRGGQVFMAATQAQSRKRYHGCRSFELSMQANRHAGPRRTWSRPRFGPLARARPRDKRARPLQVASKVSRKTSGAIAYRFEQDPAGAAGPKFLGQSLAPLLSRRVCFARHITMEDLRRSFPALVYVLFPRGWVPQPKSAAPPLAPANGSPACLQAAQCTLPVGIRSWPPSRLCWRRPTLGRREATLYSSLHACAQGD